MSNKLRDIPPVHELLDLCMNEGWAQFYSRDQLVKTIRAELNAIRASGMVTPREEIVVKIGSTMEQQHRYSLKKVINATGVIIHTNLGRAPLSSAALQHLNEIAGGYSNLEFDLSEGQRGSRDKHLESLIARILDSEASLIVNNNAAALMLVLNSLAEGKEVLVSRGELVEIGGSFRLPDIMKKSGAILREVGTTNKTRTADYRKAITNQTGMILVVHPSNFQMIGFVERPPLADLVTLGKQHNIPVVEDQGSGIFMDLASFGVADEPGVRERLATGIDLITFSGDKILGGPQAGFVCGKKIWIDRCRTNPMFRALRVDKMIYAAAEATLMSYVKGEHQEIPVIAMIQENVEQLKTRAESWIHELRQHYPNEEFSMQETQNYIGGGVAPMKALNGFAVVLKSGRPAHEISASLRQQELPIVTRVENDQIYFELRTITEQEQQTITRGLSTALKPTAEAQRR